MLTQHMQVLSALSRQLQWHSVFVHTAISDSGIAAGDAAGCCASQVKSLTVQYQAIVMKCQKDTEAC